MKENKILLEDDAFWFSFDYPTRLRLAKYIFNAINADPIGSYRTLIYRKLGFEGDACVELYQAGGMNITNAMHKENSFSDDLPIPPAT